ncbi:2,5-didehydrogluconate reductase [Bifidobacterium coryneforme]|uniref:2,5-didehydrogluconate reductase n=1 Tax=Bifidobacterium coryneforme TaxID=1687 RepID=A0ABD4AC74_9BIFI|nr:aldo/keto reductase [Bifidobacterium coryneforme]KJY53166.1 2,5-didehydrogluconate reductase [Bifidobacterium coryneforme]
MTENVTDTTLTMNNGVQIPQLGLGVFQTPDGKATSQAVTWALQAGYRHIDTAMIYGNEESAGQGIRDSGLKRRDVFLTTKLWNDDIRSGRAKEAFEESLDRLGTDYVDLYLIHWPAQGWQQAWQDMEELYRQRRVRAIGVCNFQQHHLEELHSISSTKPAVNQIESSPQFVNQELIDYCHGELRIDVEAYSPLGGTGGSVLSDPRLESISRRVGRSPAQVVLRWHIQRGLIVIPKSTHQERIEQNAQVFDFTLDEDDMKAISAMDSGIRAGADPDNFDF